MVRVAQVVVVVVVVVAVVVVVIVYVFICAMFTTTMFGVQNFELPTVDLAKGRGSNIMDKGVDGIDCAPVCLRVAFFIWKRTETLI